MRTVRGKLLSREKIEEENFIELAMTHYRRATVTPHVSQRAHVSFSSLTFLDNLSDIYQSLWARRNIKSLTVFI